MFCGGTEMTPQFHRFAVEELMEGVYFAPTYGNTLMGLATHKPPLPEDNWAIIYYPPSPRAMIEVVDPEQPDQLVGYGETGRVRLTTLTKEFFMPRFLERDQCEREAPCAQYPWDGVRNVRPFAKLGTTVVEGVVLDGASHRAHRAICCTCRSCGSASRTGASTRDGAASPHARAAHPDQPGQHRLDPPRHDAPGRGARGAARS